MELQSNYEAIKSLDTEIIAIAQEEADASTLVKVTKFVHNEFPLVADPKRESWKLFKRYGIYLVDKEGVIRVAAEGSKEARPRLDLIIEELAALEDRDAPEIEFGGLGRSDEAGFKVSDAMDVMSSRWMWSHDVVRPGDSFKLALLPMIAPGYHVYANQEKEMSPFRVEVQLPEGIEFAGPIGYPSGARLEDQPLANQTVDSNYHVYAGDIPLGAFDFKVSEDIAAGEQTVKVTLHYQACDENSCFAPVSKVLELPLQIAAKDRRRQEVFGWRTW